MNSKSFIAFMVICAYLPISLQAFAHLNVANWQWWAIDIPLIVLISIYGGFCSRRE